MQSDRRELEEQLVELGLEAGRQVARGPLAPHLGVDLGHHLVEVADPVGHLGGAVIGRSRRLGQ